MTKRPQRTRSFADLHGSAAQHFANASKSSTDLYKDGAMPRYVVNGWPCRGVLVATYVPQFGGSIDS